MLLVGKFRTLGSNSEQHSEAHESTVLIEQFEGPIPRDNRQLGNNAALLPTIALPAPTLPGSLRSTLDIPSQNLSRGEEELSHPQSG
jgi:hypothetical protein